MFVLRVGISIGTMGTLLVASTTRFAQATVPLSV